MRLKIIKILVINKIMCDGFFEFFNLVIGFLW